MLYKTKFWLFSIPLFFVAPAFVYWGIVTHFHFNLFAPDWLWPAYNEYFLSILDGHLDVPVEAIGPEGWVYGDKVYMYYGILPAIARVIVHPFIDLQTTPVSRLFVWMWSIASVSVLQWAVISHYLSVKKTQTSLLIMIMTSYVLWMGGVYLSMVQSASIYQEPYVASLFLVSCYVVLFYRDVLFRKKIVDFNLKGYALLAALSVHARPNIAIFLYLMTLVLIVYDIYSCNVDKSDKNPATKSLLKLIVNKGLVPLLILGVGGSVLLLINYLRFGNVFTLIDGLYGYYLLEGTSLKLCGFAESGRFNFARILPHAVFYFFGDYGAFKSLSAFWGLGYVSVGVPENRLIVAWIFPLVAFLWMLFYFVKKMPSMMLNNSMIFVFFIIAISSALLMLSYGTIAYRYAADLWMPFLLAILWSYTRLLNRQDSVAKIQFSKWRAPVTGLVLFLCIISPLYTMSHYELAYFSETHRAGVYSEFMGEVYLPHPKHIELMKNPPDPKTFLPCSQVEEYR